MNKYGNGMAMVLASCVLNLIFTFVLLLPGCCGACMECVDEEGYDGMLK